MSVVCEGGWTIRIHFGVEIHLSKLDTDVIVKGHEDMLKGEKEQQESVIPNSLVNLLMLTMNLGHLHNTH